MSNPETASSKAIAAWGNPVPDWIFILAQEVDATSQNQVAKRIEFSAATISQVIRKSYPSSYEPIADKVRSFLMSASVHCPFQGDGISMETCFRNQEHAKQGNRSSALRIQLGRACPKCDQWRG